MGRSAELAVARSAGFHQTCKLALTLGLLQAALKRHQPCMHLLQGLDLRHQLELLLRDRLVGALPRQLIATVPVENSLQLLELEAQLLRALDKRQQLNALRLVNPIPPLALRRWQQADVLIVTNRLDRRA